MKLQRLFDRIIFKLDRSLTRARLEYQRRRLKDQLGCLGYGCKFNGEISITGANRVFIGNNVHIGNNARIRGEGCLKIGDNTHISRNVIIYTINHNYEGTCLPYNETMIKKPVIIGENVWIGMNVMITPGSIIGEGAIIGMGTRVSGNIEPLAIVAPAKWNIIGERDGVIYERLKAEKRYGEANGKLLE